MSSLVNKQHVIHAMNAAKFQCVPLVELTNPEKLGPLMVYKDHWWASDHEGHAFFYEGKAYAPQCNPDKHIAENHLAVGRATHAIFLPWAWVKFDISDYVR